MEKCIYKHGLCMIDERKEIVRMGCYKSPENCPIYREITRNLVQLDRKGTLAKILSEETKCP